ncbi:MAG TPA: inositol monophosphatase family protein [Actinomycetota bacterium]|nr:inositol monophosphatase family protein [Actinomycetota bacterium]
MFEDELAFAHRLADEAGLIASSFFGGPLEVREKPDTTPVTEADLAIEKAIREAVHERYPADGVLGEEGGLEGESGDRRWVVDPIDGTKNFADGIQIFATLIALVIEERTVLGVIEAPAIGERYEAVRGEGARLNGTPIRVSRADRISRSSVLHSSLAGWLDGPYRDPLEELMREARRDRGFGDFWGHMLVARGSADVMFEPELATWDFAAVEVVVTEAGGRVTQFDGSPLEHGKSVLSTNGVLHDEILARLDHGREAEVG